MLLSEKHFTKSSVVDRFKIGDGTIHYIGYLDYCGTNEYYTTKDTKFYKIVLNNADNRRVQVIAWQGHIEKLKQCKKENTIIHVGPVQAVKIKPGQEKWNHGNMGFQLVITNDSKINISPTLYEHMIDESKCQNVSITEAYSKDKQSIIVSGFIKTSFDVFKNRDSEYISASLADTETKQILEIRGYFDYNAEVQKLEKFSKIKVAGVMGKETKGPMYLQVYSMKNIIMCNEKANPLDVLKSYIIPS